MKKLTLFVAALCATTMAVNAAEVAVATCDFSLKTAKSNAYAEDEWTYGDYTLAWAANNDGQWEYVKFGAKSKTATNSTGYVKSSKIAKQIDKIEVNFNSGNLTVGSCSTWGVEVYSDAKFSTLIEKVNGVAMPAKKDTTITLVPSVAGKWVANSYYKVFFDCAGGKSNGVVWVNSIKFMQDVEGAPVDPTISVASGAYVAAQSVELKCATEGAKIYYTLDGTEPTAASTLYTAAIAIDATTTIKAIAINNDILSNVVSATYVFTTGAGTKENPFTIADVQELISYAVAPSDAVWVEGYILGSASYDSQLKSLKILEGDDVLDSNIAIASVAGETDAAKYLPVQLPYSATAGVRDALNVKDNASNVGKKVKVYGTLESYMSVAGVKNTSDYVLETSPATALENVEALEVYAENGRIYAAEGARIFTVSGIDVTEMNGQLNGIYIVKVGNQATKIAVK